MTMLRRSNRWIRMAAAGAALALVTTGCSLGGSRSIDPPQVGYEVKTGKEAKAASAEAGKHLAATGYFLDAGGYTAPLQIRVPAGDGIAKQVLSHMVDGGPGSAQLPQGFRALLPKGTIVKGIDIKTDEKLAIIDFSKEFANYNMTDERKILEAITWSMTTFPTVEKVQLRVEGVALKEMPLDGTPLDMPLSRKTLGINLEASKGVNFGRASAVTLYFAGKTKDNKSYYVPVTRLIHQTDDLVKATMAELIKGPSGKSLASVILPTAEVLNSAATGDIITVDFSDKLLGPDQKAPSESLQAVVLSLTETVGQSTKVQIKVNGDAKVNATDNRSYAQPVMRPEHINEIKL